MDGALVGVNACRSLRASPPRELRARPPSVAVLGARKPRCPTRHAVAASPIPPSAPRRLPTAGALVECSSPSALVSAFSPAPPLTLPSPPPSPASSPPGLSTPLHSRTPCVPPCSLFPLCVPPPSPFPSPPCPLLFVPHSSIWHPPWWRLRAVAWARPYPCESLPCGGPLLARSWVVATPLATEGAPAPSAWWSAGQWCRWPWPSRARPAVPAAGRRGRAGAARRALIPCTPRAPLARLQQQCGQPRRPQRWRRSCLRCSRRRSGSRWGRRLGEEGWYQVRQPRVMPRRTRRARHQLGPPTSRHRRPRHRRQHRRAAWASHAWLPLCGHRLGRARRQMLAGAPRQRL